MKTIKIRMKANELSEADVSFVSLVTRPANRIPFKVLKSEDVGEKKMAIRIGDLFKTKEDTQKLGILGALIRKEDTDRLSPILKSVGMKTDSFEENDGIVIYKQADYEGTEEVAPIKINDDLIVLVEAKKYFDAWPAGAPLTVSVDAQLFYPGVSLATDVLKSMVDKALFDARNAEEFKTKMKEVVGQYSKYVMGLADMLPDIVFKAEAEFGKELQKTKEKVLPNDIKKSDTKEAASEGVEMTTDVNKDDPSEKEEVKVEKAEHEACDMEDGTKGHMVDGKCVAKTAKAKEEAAVAEETVVTEVVAEVKTPDFMAAIAEMNKALQAGLAAVTEQVTKSVDSINQRIDGVEKVAKSADQAIRGTAVRKGEEEVGDQALGTVSRKKGDDGIWGGTALDKLG